MFEKRRAKKAQEEYERELSDWQAERDGTASLLKLAESYGGESSTELMLKPGEAVFAYITGAGLIEDRRGRGRYEGRSSGVSIPVGSIGGRSVRYRVGASRGHFVQGAPVPTAVDRGTLYVTNKRVVFVGGKQTRECAFDKLVGFRHSNGETTFSVSNRQKATTVHYGPQLDDWFDFRLDLALAHYRDTVPQFVAQMKSQLNGLDAAKPQPPSALPTLSV